MKSLLLLPSFLIVFSLYSVAQVGIGPDNSNPARSAMLDISSSSKGLLVPRLTQDQIQTITSPANSLLVFCTTDNKFYAFMTATSEWKEILYGTGTITPTCGLPFTDDRDQRTYNTVQVGTQCWISGNMDIGTRINGSQTQANNGVIEKYCFNNLDTNCSIYGGLYQWDEMMQFTTTPGAQGICPAGWHLPTDGEMMAMVTYLGGLGIAGGKLKETGTMHWSSPNTGATDETGFTAFAASFRDYMGGFSTPLGERTSFWTSTQNGTSYGWDYTLVFNSDDITRNSGAMKSNGFSVRCLKN